MWPFSGLLLFRSPVAFPLFLSACAAVMFFATPHMLFALGFVICSAAAGAAAALSCFRLRVAEFFFVFGVRFLLGLRAVSCILFSFSGKIWATGKLQLALASGLATNC